MTDVRIYVATHQKCDDLLKIPYPYYIPIHCGKEIYEEAFKKYEYNYNKEGYLPELGDNTGDNISRKNLSYCELTAMYWIWKNDTSGPDDIVGLNHYRRYFADPREEGDEKNIRFLSKENIIKSLKNYDFLVNGSDTESDYECEENESVYKGYKDCHIIEDLDITLEGMEKLYPEKYEILRKSIKNTGAMCVCNMLIARKKDFDKYCEFLFSILSYVEERIDLNDDKHEGYNGRVFGFLGERILRPWMMAFKYKAKGEPPLDWDDYLISVNGKEKGEENVSV